MSCEKGYMLGNKMVNNKEDNLFQQALKNLPMLDIMTIRDRIADSFAIGSDSRQKEVDDLRGRVIELETAIKWWLNDRMKGFSETQYGKENMRKILEAGSLPVQET